jgi:glycerophosphoryl diester phosphodiesterase
MKRLALMLVLGMSVGPVGAQSIVAHRGSSDTAPENTLAAFRLAWEQNADAIEGDFYLTADQKIVCIHDKTTERTCPDQPSLVIADSSLDALKQLDVGTWKSQKFTGEKIPTLAEVLETVPSDKQIFVEIKCGVEIIPHLKTALEESKLEQNQIVIIAFSKSVVESVRRAMPAYKCNWLTSYKNKNVAQAWRPTKPQVQGELKTLKATGLGSSFNLDVVSQEWVKAIHDDHCEFHVWTLDSPEHIKAAIEMGVDSITTNRPDVALAIRQESVPATKPELANPNESKK